MIKQTVLSICVFVFGTSLCLAQSNAPLQSPSNNGEQPPTLSTGAPAVRKCQTNENLDLGTWDDVFVCDEQDGMILRRGDTLFSLGMSDSSKPERLAASAALKGTHIVTSAASDKGLWLFMQSSESEPFAMNTQSGQVSQFIMPGQPAPSRHTSYIQSYIIIRHFDAAFVMVGGGPQMTYWMSLKSGKVQPVIPAALDYFSSDQKVAVCQDQLAMDVATGERVPNFTKRDRMEVLPFRWTETRTIKPLALWGAGIRAAGAFAGLSVGGAVFPMPGMAAMGCYLASAKTNDGFLGFRLRPDGSGDGEPASFWVMRLQQDQPAVLAADGVADFAMLNAGDCVFTGAGDGRSGSPEAWFRDHHNKVRWNVLDGIQRLPDLDQEYVGKEYIENQMTIRLIGGFGGNKRQSIVLCLFSHLREDMRQQFIPNRLNMKWHCAMLVTSAGQRYATGLFRDGNVPGYIWVHNSGKIFTGNEVDSPTGRKIQLSETPVHFL